LLLISSGSDVVPGRPNPPDTGRFLAYPGLEGDTIVLTPFRVRDVRGGKPGIVPPTFREALKQQRRLFYSMAMTWVAAFPRSPYALEALALSLELLGDRSALGVLQRARSLASDPDERARLAASETWLRLKLAIPEDSASLVAIRALADSIIRENPPSTGREPFYLAGLAALTGRAALASAYNQRHADATVVDASPSLARDGYALLAFAALGGPLDSLTTLEGRVERAIEQTIPAEARKAAQTRWLLQPAALAFPAHRFVVLPALAGTDWAVMEAEISLTRGDTAVVRQALADVARRRRPVPVEDVTIDALYPEAWLLVAAGDADAAAQRLDPAFATLRDASPGILAEPARAGALVRAMVLRAQLADRAGDRSAARWARAVTILWSGADAFLQPTVQEMARIAHAARAM
jgi:hypothetical protein